MFHPNVHHARRERLQSLVEGPVLLFANDEQTRNLPINKLPFRQDSTFLYFTGCCEPGAALLLDEHGSTLFLRPKDDDDDLWHGPSPSWEQVQSSLGVDRIAPLDRLEQMVAGRNVRTLAVADLAVNQRASALTGRALAFGRDHGDDALVDAVIQLRRVKGPEELQAMRQAAHVTDLAFRAVIGATRVGSTERGLHALFTGMLAARGCEPGYAPILTVRGEILHNHDHSNTLADGDLLLLDGGGEVASGHGVDVTRTWPVNGTFAPRQRAAYAAVLQAQLNAIDACRAGVRYREVHDTACRTLASWLRDEGLLRCSVDEAIASGAHGVFYPHGTGHHLGMDVHDLENFGDRPSYPVGQPRPPQFGTRYLRLDLALQPGWVVTVEPGFYVVPAILDNPRLRETLGDRVDWDRAQQWMGFGGIRIEDDVAVTDVDPEVLTQAIPKAIDDIEALTGSGAPVEERLC